LPIFKSIAASKLDATPILSQVVDRYAQRWKNEQVLGANKI